IPWSRLQRGPSERRACCAPVLSTAVCGARLTFITFPFVAARSEKAAGARSLRLAADGFEDRRPARELVLENACRVVGPDAVHRLEAEPDELTLEVAVGRRLLGDRVDTL